jgi:hypothetical protein
LVAGIPAHDQQWFARRETAKRICWQQRTAAAR